MANHLRRQIRDAVKATLTGLATTGSNVFASRAYDLQDNELPALRITTGPEETTIASMGQGRVREHQLELVIEACVKANTAYDDTLDQIAKEVEVALDANNGLGGLVKWIEPVRFEPEFSGEADKVIAVGKMTFQVYYMTAQNAPDVAL